MALSDDANLLVFFSFFFCFLREVEELLACCVLFPGACEKLVKN
jgi:hypothetical protein